MIPTNSSTRPTLHIVVLAAGFSARLGRPKALARVRGTSLIRRTVRLLAPLGASRIHVVVPPKSVRVQAELRGQRVTVVHNSQRAQGLSASVRRGLERARHSAAVLLLPVDLAHLRSPDLERMVARWSGARRCVVAQRIGEHGGTPLILPRWLYSRARRVTGDRGLRDLVGQLGVGELALVNLPSAQWDVDTPQDLADARHRARARAN